MYKITDFCLKPHRIPDMRVGFDAKRAFNNKTGLGNYSRFVLEALNTYYPEHHYVAYTPKNSQNLFSEFPTEQIVTPHRWIDKKLSAYWRHARITSQLVQDKIDVYHGLSHELPTGLREAGIASVVTIHDLIFERLPSLFKPVDRMIYRSKFKSACSRADAIIAISEQTKRDLVALYRIAEDRIKVIYQDCNPIFQIPVEASQRRAITEKYGITEPYVLSVGTIEERKNQLNLVRAFSLADQPGYQLVLVGKPTPYTEKIRQFIAEKKLKNRVLVLDSVPTAHLPALYQQADVFAYISIYEGFGIPILEALKSGTPVLAAKGSCLEEAGGPGGLYADPTDLRAIADQMQTLLSDQTLRAGLVKAGQHYIERFEGKTISSQLTALYREINSNRLSY
jgi:glycosyltransferase involved in cell wall biosynthesis